MVSWVLAGAAGRSPAPRIPTRSVSTFRRKGGVSSNLNFKPQVIGDRGLYRGLYFGPKMIFIFPPLLKMLFVPLSKHVIFRLPSWPFCLNSSLCCIYFILLLPIFSFSFPFLPFFPFSFFLFLLHFPPLSLRLFIFFPK
jgi:hypothetical protein